MLQTIIYKIKSILPLVVCNTVDFLPLLSENICIIYCVQNTFHLLNKNWVPGEVILQSEHSSSELARPVIVKMVLVQSITKKQINSKLLRYNATKRTNFSNGRAVNFHQATLVQIPTWIIWEFKKRCTCNLSFNSCCRLRLNGYVKIMKLKT